MSTNYNEDEIKIMPTNETEINDISDHHFYDNIVAESIEAVVNENSNDHINQLVNDTYTDATDTSARCM